MSTSAKKSKGRQKVVMTRMAKDSNRQVTFSKRRLGLFKKASELCTLCGAEAAIIVFSPGQKAFSFGHPSVEAIINQFLMTNPLFESNCPELADEQQNDQVHELGNELTVLGHQMHLEKRRGEEISDMRKACGSNVSIEDLNLQDLEHFKRGLEELRSNVIMEGNRLMMEASRNNNGAPLYHMGTNPMVGFDANHGYGQGYYLEP